MQYLRAEEPSLSGEDCDEDLVHLRNLAEELGEAEVGVLGHCVEFLLIAEGDDGDSAAHLEGNDLLGIEARHGGCYFCVVEEWRCVVRYFLLLKVVQLVVQEMGEGVLDVRSGCQVTQE